MTFFKTKPWSHQEEALTRCKDLDEFALFFEMGTGKTKTVIDILRYKFAKHKQVLSTLILSPPITLQNWKREFEIHSNIAQDIIVVLSGSQIKRRKLFKANKHKACIFITNYEATLMKDLYEDLKEYNPAVLICDESHKCKSMQSKRTKAVIKLSKDTMYRYILTGTSILNTSMDIFSQFLILDKGETFGKNFFSFRGEFFYDKNAGMPKGSHFPMWIARPKAAQELNSLIFTKAMKVVKSECLDLPPLLKQVIKIEMTRPQLTAYRKMQKEFITFIEEKACVAELAITKALRLQQIVTGFMKLDDGTIHRFKENPRREALKELLSNLTPDHKVIVWAVFKENYKDISEVCEELKIGYTEIHGGVKENDKFDNVDRFNNDEDCRVLFGHPLSGGIGINLVVATYSIFYSRNYSLEQDLQAEARNYRGGSEVHEKITRIDLVAPDTIDEDIQKRLAAKLKVSDEILLDMTRMDKR